MPPKPSQNTPPARSAGPSVVDVVGAVIRDGDRVLLARRPEGKAQAGLWEFPGGKIEPFELRTCNYDAKVYVPLCANAATLKDAIGFVIGSASGREADGLSWARGRYSPTPTIIQAASALYSNHNVDDITRCDAGENLKTTTDFILGVIDHARKNREKSICFVTGVPGAAPCRRRPGETRHRRLVS